jgi:YD repeat-containing protein
MPVEAAVVFTKDAFTPAPGQFNALNQTAVNSAAYDAASNQSGIGGFSRTHDAENRIVQSILNGITTTFAYDGEGRRVKKGSTTANRPYQAEEFRFPDSLGSPRLKP